MYRVIVALLAAVAVSGCSLGTQSLPLNLSSAFSGSPKTKIDPDFAGSNKLGDYATASTTGGGGSSAAAPARAAPAQQRTALLDDRAPKKSTTKAPPGALADRSYQKTNLDVAKAREMINAYRKANGLAPLTVDAQLTRAAKAHSRDLAKWDRISHYGSDGSNPWDRVRRAGYKASLAAENVGTGQASLEEVFAGWKKSPGHNKNLLLKDAKHMGIALIHDGKTEFKTFWTLVLGSKS